MDAGRRPYDAYPAVETKVAMRNRLVRTGLAKKAARRIAVELLTDPEAIAEAFSGEELTAEERLLAHSELRQIVAGIRATMADGGY